MTGPAPPGVPVRVTPQEFHDAGQRFADAQARVDEIAGRLRTTLSGLAGAAGDDDAARNFDRAYLPGADGTYGGLARLTGLVGAIGHGLGVSAENHRRGDADSAPGTAPGVPFPPITVRPAPTATGAPTLTGHPAYWVPDWAEQYWPNGDPDGLHAAATAWYTAADGITRLGDDLHAVLTGLVRANDGDDVRALAAFWDRVGRSDGALFTALPRACTALGDACGRFADAVAEAHRTMLDVIGKVLLGAVLVGVGILLTAPTLGGSDVVAGGAGATAIAGAVAELEVLAAALLAAVGGGLAIAGVATAGDALRFAIENTPDPRVTQADTTRIGDGLGRGAVDESARPFSAEERRIADKLAADGKKVKALLEDSASQNRQPDALVDDVATEFKTLDPSGRGDSNTIRNVLGRSKKNGGQASDIVIDGEYVGLTREEALRGITRFQNAQPGHFQSITIYARDGIVRWP